MLRTAGNWEGPGSAGLMAGTMGPGGALVEEPSKPSHGILCGEGWGLSRGGAVLGLWQQGTRPWLLVSSHPAVELSNHLLGRSWGCHAQGQPPNWERAYSQDPCPSLGDKGRLASKEGSLTGTHGYSRVVPGGAVCPVVFQHPPFSSP